MKAIHKYKHSAQQGNTEAQRRIAQSLGYRFSIWDMPQMITLLQRAGLDMSGDVPNPIMVDTDTLKL